ncbi:MAG TPA: D-hexose-6-phosphate mutarotase [Tepidisphaeraceae bacterium]|nr:D-hexose-6-phosphate mutarotase [Tepidisphaeraceae bacterium]
MSTIEELNNQFGIPGVARVEGGAGGLPRVAVTAPGGAEAHVYLHGAHVSHYRPAAGAPPVLYQSPRSAYADSKAIRAGVPVIFPWFGPRHGTDTAAMHGFVRTRAWELQAISRQGDDVRVSFALSSTPEMLAAANFPHAFALRLNVTVAATLAIEMEVENRSAQELPFENALHTYFHVGDVRQISVSGLADTDFLDKNRGMSRFTDREDPLRFAGPTDRVYLDTPATCTIVDPVLGRRIVLAKDGSRTTVVWNPWSDKITSMADLPAEDWPKFVCVETCNARDNALRLPPGGRHAMRLSIHAEAL